VRASNVVARSKPVNGPTLTYPATTAYKQWVRKQMQARGWTQQKLVDEMKRVDRSLTTISTATITDFLGPEGDTPIPSNSKLLPAMNKVFGIAPPPVCDPTDELAQIRDRFSARWAKLTAREQRMLLELLTEEPE
jgi:hypothetical protein